jgi:hypothetical protein
VTFLVATVELSELCELWDSWRGLKTAARMKQLLGAMLAPPCSSFSVARDCTSVIRTATHPCGLPGISHEDQQKVDLGNACVRAAVDLIRCFNRHSVLGILEQP